MKDTQLEIDGVRLNLRIARKRVRNVNARLIGNELRVSAPPQIPQTELEALIAKMARKLVRRRLADQINSSDEALNVAKKVASRFPKPPPISDLRFVTTQRSRWGSYSRRTGVVRIHAGLRVLPCWVLESVVAHELAHAFVPNHSPEFWVLLHSVDSKADQTRAFLQGVSWIAQRWEELPPVERELLARSD
jgi:predicted metal-dependent hydrolase